MAALASELRAAGIDQISGADGSLTVSVSDAIALAGGEFGSRGTEDDLRFAAADMVTLAVESPEVIDEYISEAAALNIDQIHALGGSLTISDAQAGYLVEAGLHFVTEDTVTLEASGTHLSTSLDDLQKLGVDSVVLHANSLSPSDLGSFSSSLNVVLDVGSTSLAEATLAGGAENPIYGTLKAKGIDQLAISKDIGNGGANWLDLNLLNSIHQQSDLGFWVDLSASTQSGSWTSLDESLLQLDPLKSFTDPAQYSSLISALQGSGVTELFVSAGNVDVQDQLAKALVDAGMLHALPEANIKLDALTSGDHLFTTLADMAKLDIDQVESSATKLYVDLGLPIDEPATMAEIKHLLQALDPLNETKLFNNNDVALVIDQSALAAPVESFDQEVLQGLKSTGFTEIDILDTAHTSASSYQLSVDPVTGVVTAQIVDLTTNEAIDLYNHLHKS